MPFFIPKRRVSDAENKLRLLCCLSHLGVASMEQLWPFVAQLELMDYIPYCLLMDELQNDGAVAAGRHALAGMLYLTAEGERTLTLLGDKLMTRDRERIAKAAPAYAAQLNERRMARAAYERAQPGLWGALLTVREGDVPALCLRLTTPDEKLANAAVTGFQAAAPKLLQLFYTLPFAPNAQALPLLDTEEAALGYAKDGAPALCAYGAREHAAAVPISDGENRYQALLLLPGREEAQGWAAAATAQGTALAKRITALLASAQKEPMP